ncbi:uncharacterized protein [Drosophila bipectinata]|uniref:uncharacterized protein n=1 Tax=Drosophila bipectinata TaxID=42026 RepID=UPI0038B3FB69
MKNWKIFSKAVSNFAGHLQIVYLRAASSAIKKIGSAAILEGIKMVLGKIKTSTRLTRTLVGAVADKCAANMDAIKFMQNHGIPVLYDLHHFQNTMTRSQIMDVIITSLYTTPVPIFTKDNYEKKLSGFERVVENKSLPIARPLQRRAAFPRVPIWKSLQSIPK